MRKADFAMPLHLKETGGKHTHEEKPPLAHGRFNRSKRFMNPRGLSEPGFRESSHINKIRNNKR